MMIMDGYSVNVISAVSAAAQSDVAQRALPLPALPPIIDHQHALCLPRQLLTSPSTLPSPLIDAVRQI